MHAKRALEAGLRGETRNFTGRYLDAARSATYWSVTVTPMRSPGGGAARALVTSRDVTTQSLASAAGRGEPADDRFDLFVDSVKDYALFLLDPAGTVMTWNEGAQRIKGYEAREIIGEHFSRFYTPEDLTRNHPAEELQIAAREGKFEEEGWRVKKDGTRFWASVVISRVLDHEGRVVGFAKVTRDLTERRAVEKTRVEEESLRDREQLLEQVFSVAPSFMTLISVPEFRYLKSNEEHRRLIGKSDVIGKSVLEVEPGLEGQGIMHMLRDVATSGEPFIGREVEAHYPASGGRPARTVYLDFVFQPLRRLDGEVYAITAQGYDVTTRVLSRRAVDNERENFRRLFKQTPEMVCILRGPDHVFEFVNEAHVKVLGFDATGMSVREAQPESVEVHGILDEVYRTGRTAFLNEIPVTVGDRLRYFNLTYAARRDESGEIDGIMILGTEITDQIEDSKRLEKAVRTRDEFLSIASHELKTPLTSLKLQIQLRARDIRRGNLQRFAPENVAKLVADDEKQVNRLIRLVEDMLDVSRINTGKITYAAEDFDFCELVRETAARYAPQFEQAHVPISVYAEGHVPVRWDRFRIEQVFVNLLTNALKYGNGNPVEVRAFEKAGDAVLVVRDQGLGIAQKDQTRIFGQFERATSGNNIAGLGLGLYISRKIVEAHQGQIYVDSAEGHGSSFRAVLPRVPTWAAAPASG